MFSMMTFVKSIYFCLECGAGAYIWSLDHDSRNPRAKVCGESSNHWTFQLQKPAGPALCAGKLHRVLIPSFPICFSMLLKGPIYDSKGLCLQVQKLRVWVHAIYGLLWSQGRHREIMLISEIFLELLQPMEEEHTIVRGHRCRGVVINYTSVFLDFTGSPRFSHCLWMIVCFNHGHFIVR